MDESMKVLFSSESNEWRTPDDLYSNLNKRFKFTLDPASTDENAKCEKHFTEKQNGLEQSWEGETVFLNPPYGREIGKWVEKTFKESRKDRNHDKVILIPARTDTQYFAQYCRYASELYFIEGRLKFSNSKNSAPFPSVIVVFNEKRFLERSYLERKVLWCNKDFTNWW